jgi:hypothetical protein
MATSPQHQLLQLARRVAIGGVTALTGWTGYKAKTDPIHLFWDLDHTILCSVTPCPMPTTAADDNRNNGHDVNNNYGDNNSDFYSSIIKPPALDYFDQIDDDFPYNATTLAPNTRTYFRPGAKTALKICSKLGVCHVYTAAQESYTMNILNALDPNRELFRGFVLHRSDYPKIVTEGKDLNVAIGKKNSTAMDEIVIRLERAILFDDKVSNFIPQRYENGVGVVPFTLRRLNKCLSKNNDYIGSSSGSSDISNRSNADNNNNNNYNRCALENWVAYLDEVKEMSRLVGVSLWGTVHFSGDVRKVVGWVRKLNPVTNRS